MELTKDGLQVQWLWPAAEEHQPTGPGGKSQGPRAAAGAEAPGRGAARQCCICGEGSQTPEHQGAMRHWEGMARGPINGTRRLTFWWLALAAVRTPGAGH